MRANTEFRSRPSNVESGCCRLKARNRGDSTGKIDLANHAVVVHTSDNPGHTRRRQEQSGGRRSPARIGRTARGIRLPSCVRCRTQERLALLSYSDFATIRGGRLEPGEASAATISIPHGRTSRSLS